MGEERRRGCPDILKAVILSLTLMVLAGCSMSGTIYEMAADERDAKEIITDGRIRADIQKSFLDDSEMKALDIWVYCFNGNVYLVGECDGDLQKKKAVSIAQNTAGVKSVETYILPKNANDPCGARDNLAITAKLKARLMTDLDVWSTSISFKVVQCRIVLLGIAESDEELAKVKADAESVEGSRGVTSFLKTSN